MVTGKQLPSEVLLSDIHHKDKFFRSLTLFIIFFVLVGVIIALFGEIRILNRIQHSQDTQNQYIHCLAEFFSQPDRQEKILQNVDSCTVDGVAISSPTPTNTTILGSAPADNTPPKPISPLGTSQTSQPTSQVGNTNNNDNGSGQSTTPVTPGLLPVLTQDTQHLVCDLPALGTLQACSDTLNL